MRFTLALIAVLLFAPFRPTAANASVTRPVQVTKTVTVRTVITRKVIQTDKRKTFHRYVHRHRVILVRRIHPESCFLPPDVIVALNAPGPYCSSVYGMRHLAVRY